MPRQIPPPWLRLGAELRKLRSLSGLSTRELATRTGLSNARVSRVETGRSLLALPEVDAWATAVGADADARQRLHTLAEAAHTPAVDPFHTAGTELQHSVLEIEARAGRIVTVQPQIVPGLLQTAGYARAVLELADVTGQDIPAAVAVRMRRQEALYDPAKRFTFVLTEAGLRWPAGDDSMMAAQYDRIMQISTLNNVEIGVIPLGRPVSALPWCDLNLYDDLADGEPPVIDIELPHAEIWITNPTDVAVYVGLVQRLWESSLTGDAARTLLTGLTNQTGRR